jgi:hypothetical protein
MTIESLKQTLDNDYEGSLFDDDGARWTPVKPQEQKNTEEFASICVESDGIFRHHNINKQIANGTQLKDEKRLEYAFCDKISIGDFIDVYSYVTKMYRTLKITKIVEKKPAGFLVVAE